MFFCVFFNKSGLFFFGLVNFFVESMVFLVFGCRKEVFIKFILWVGVGFVLLFFAFKVIGLGDVVR